jgi:hypothetical protein
MNDPIVLAFFPVSLLLNIECDIGLIQGRGIRRGHGRILICGVRRGNHQIQMCGVRFAVSISIPTCIAGGIIPFVMPGCIPVIKGVIMPFIMPVCIPDIVGVIVGGIMPVCIPAVAGFIMGGIMPVCIMFIMFL